MVLALPVAKKQGNARRTTYDLELCFIFTPHSQRV